MEKANLNLELDGKQLRFLRVALTKRMSELMSSGRDETDYEVDTLANACSKISSCASDQACSERDGPAGIDSTT